MRNRVQAKRKKGNWSGERSQVAVFRCSECGGVHRARWNGPHMYKLPCAFDKHGAYRRNAVLYVLLAKPPQQLQLPICG